jgi:hypothetical protein
LPYLVGIPKRIPSKASSSEGLLMTGTSGFFAGACILVRTSWGRVSGILREKISDCFIEMERSLVKIKTYWKMVASPPASLIPFNSASAYCDVVSRHNHLQELFNIPAA